MINDDQNTTASPDLAQIREDIDSVDMQIQQLINRRAKLAEADFIRLINAFIQHHFQ